MILASGFGAIRRGIRRLLRRPPRIWFGHAPLHATAHTADATRLAGFPSRTVVTSAHAAQYDLVTRRDFDVVFGEPEVPKNERHWRALADLLWHGDVWVAYFDSHFFPPARRRANELSLTLIGSLGIRIVVITHGSDILQLTPNRTRFDWVERMQLDYPAWSFAEQTIASRERLRLFDAYADLVIAPYHAIRRLMRRADLIFTPFSITGEESPLPSNPIPVILHAPNHRHVKGTGELIAAVERLNARGIRCELRLVEGVPRDEALKMYGQADIIADQLIIGAFGVFAPEGMAIGRPVLTYLDQDMLGDPVFNYPLVNAHIGNVEDVLAALVQVPELRVRLGRAGRESAQRYLSPAALADVWRVIIGHLWWGQPLELESTGHFSRARKPRAFSEDPADGSFWPVDVSDLMGEIREAVGKNKKGAV